MKTRLALLLLLCSGMAAAQAANVFKWKDEKGVTHFSDTPPPAKTVPRSVELRNYNTAAPTPTLPASLAAVVRANPVTLYTTSQCAICDTARAMLRARGIPYAEKTVHSDEDIAALRSAGSAGSLPFLRIGSGRHAGFDQVTWDEALTAAGYPEQIKLPTGYRPPAPASAAPPATAQAPAVNQQDQAASPPRLPPVNATPDFQF